jgi:hypothetical protein
MVGNSLRRRPDNSLLLLKIITETSRRRTPDNSLLLLRTIIETNQRRTIQETRKVRRKDMMTQTAIEARKIPPGSQ